MIARAFESARAQKRVAFVPYVMAGDPDLETTEAIVAALRDAGADIIELGIPYGDPLADGPTIAAAGQRALANGVRVADVLALTKRVRNAGAPPIVLFTYFNPVLQFGVERFARDAVAAGANGVIVPDVALEETAGVRATFAKEGLAMPLLVAPSTPPDRAAQIAAAATGFVYVVSRLGVTGARSEGRFDAACALIRLLRNVTDKPLAVGFGVSTPEHVREIATFADGAIVGSALIDAYGSSSGANAAEKIAAFARELVAAT